MYCETIIAMKYHQNIVYFKKLLAKELQYQKQCRFKDRIRSRHTSDCRL